MAFDSKPRLVGSAGTSVLRTDRQKVIHHSYQNCYITEWLITCGLGGLQSYSRVRAGDLRRWTSNCTGHWSSALTSMHSLTSEHSAWWPQVRAQRGWSRAPGRKCSTVLWWNTSCAYMMTFHINIQYYIKTSTFDLRRWLVITIYLRSGATSNVISNGHRSNDQETHRRNWHTLSNVMGGPFKISQQEQWKFK